MRDLEIYLCYVLRHKPEDIHLTMDKHGWVYVSELICKINDFTSYTLTEELLKQIVATDNKQRFKFDDNCERIKCCQGHSTSWVEPELEYKEPPKFLYHGTTVESMRRIESSGFISKMERHAVHLSDNMDKAWQSAGRWHTTPVLLKIDSNAMFVDGYKFGVSENGVWCVEEVPVKYICDKIYKEGE